jgi:superfamily II DNA/RNA helicase
MFAKLNPKRAAVQALVVVPTRELGMQVSFEGSKVIIKHSEYSVDGNMLTYRL